MSAEPTKRVSFMTIDSSTSDFLKKPEKESTAGNSKSKTIRINLDIFEPTEYKFPEFNFKKLIHIEKKKQKKLAKLSNGAHTNTNEDDPFGGGDDDDVARIAREMEAKYGTGSSYSKTSRVEFDRGTGYDENDPFIDNTEAYDEIIPEDVETVRGGFYVNSGLLEFKKMPNFERPGDEIRMPKAKKRVLSSSESSDGEENTEKSTAPAKAKKKKVHLDKKAKSATSSSDEQGKAAKKSKKDKQEKPKEILPPTKEVEKKKALEKESVDDSKKVIKTTTVKDMLRAKRDNLRKMEQGKSSGGTTTTTDNDDDDGSESISSLAVSESSRDSNPEDVAMMNGASTAIKELSLPSNFSPELAQLITSLKQYADTQPKISSNFFDNNVKEQLLKIDTVAKSQSPQVRLQVYIQLETFLPCTRKSILAKVNRFRVQQADGKVKAEIKKLKSIVNTSMPDLVRKYDEDLKTFENLKDIQTIVGDNSVHSEQRTPRKKYHWNDNSRQILNEVVQLISELFKISKIKKESLEEFSLRYLKDHLLPLWPEGWIKLEDFNKELERKKKKDARAALPPTPPQGTSITTITTQLNSTPNGKQSSAQMPSQQQKTENRSKDILDIMITSPPAVNGKSSSTTTQLSPPSHSSSSVIKKPRASDHSINSIMSSTSPSPPIIHSTTKAPSSSSSSTTSAVQIESKTRVIDLDKLSSPNDLLKVSQKDINRIPKYSHDMSAEKIRISDGSDSDCAIIDSPIKTTTTKTTVKPQNLNNNKINHSSVIQQQQQQQVETKKAKKYDDGYSSLIKNIASLTDPKKNSQSFLSNPLSTSMNDQRKMDTSHGLNGTTNNNEHFMDPPIKSLKGYNSNLHYSINELIVNTSRSGSQGNVKSSDYQKYTSNANNNATSLVHNISVITSTNDAGKSNNNFAMSPILNLSNKK